MFYMQRNLVAAIHEDRHREADTERLSGATRLMGGSVPRRERFASGLFGSARATTARSGGPAMPFWMRRSALRAPSTTSTPAS
jgi:hypothetical protein